MASLADLQTEREKLRALAAKSDYDTAFAETLAARDVLSAASQLRGSITAALFGLPRQLAQAIDGQHDETRTHYLLADAAHTWLTALGASAEVACAAMPQLGEQFRRGAQPRDLLTVSEWADRNRWLRSGTNSPGRWNTALTPYLREPMDALSEHSSARSVVFMKSSGVGGTEALFNWVGYTMQHLQNKDLLIVVPTLELRERSFNPRLFKMIEESDVLRDLVSQASRSKVNRADILEYGAHARIIRSGANSPDSLRSDHLPYVICDEVDAFPWDVGGEGDPMTLIENRQRTFSRAKSYFVSTPTLKGRSRITMLFDRSDQRRYHVLCPHCAQLQHLEFDRVGTAAHGLKWRLAPEVDTETGEVMRPRVEACWYVCRHCNERIAEHHKTDMLSGGRWIPAKPAARRHRGYHINALYSPVGLGLTWMAVAQKWLDCQGDTAEMKAFVNTYLGLPWEEQGDNIEDISLISRLEAYNPIVMMTARAFRFITVGVDVQKNRLEASIVGWGDREEAWVLEHLIVPGDTTDDAVWNALDEGLAEWGIAKGGIDSGYNTSNVYSFCSTRRWAVPIKGVSGTNRPIIEDAKRRAMRLRRRAKNQHAVEPIGVDQAKALIYARLKLDKPGPGFIHFPREPAFDDEYFAQLAAEKLVTKVRGTRPFQEWVQTRARNEALDCLVYAFAAMRLVAINLNQPPPEKTESTQTTPTRPRRRRVISSAAR